MSDPDEILVERHRRGDPAAFRELVERHQRGVHALCFKWLRDPDEADEVTQLTFVRVFRRLESFGGRASFRTWLYRVALNACRNRVRDEKRRRTEELVDVPDPRSDALDSLVGGELAKAVERAVAELPERQRAVVELRLYRDLPYHEIARIVGSSAGAAKVNYHYAIRTLREKLRARGVGRG